MAVPPDAADPILAEMIRRLVAAVRPQRIYLFGSRARGEGGAHSDYDLMVVLETSDLPQYKRDQAAFRALCGVGASKDVLVLTRSEFERKLQVVASLPATVVREGRLVYES
jgi:predicted nucleotidyltransferase